MSTSLLHTTIQTPIGEMHIISSQKGISLLEFFDRKELEKEIKDLEIVFDTRIESGENKHSLSLKKELNAYFKGKLTEFTTPILFNGTEFQKKVWESLLKIPFGTTKTYKEQSIVLGDLKAIRAVASANGKNKMSIIVPCHRVIGSDGSLTGYAGGIERKRFLLNLERKIAGPKDLFNS